MDEIESAIAEFREQRKKDESEIFCVPDVWGTKPPWGVRVVMYPMGGTSYFLSLNMAKKLRDDLIHAIESAEDKNARGMEG